MYIPNNGRAEETLEVAAAGELKAGNELLGDGRSANNVALLENGNGEAAPSQISGGRQTVVAAANHQCVPFLFLELACETGATVARATSPHF